MWASFPLAESGVEENHSSQRSLRRASRNPRSRGRATRHVLPIAVGNETIECSGSFCESDDSTWQPCGRGSDSSSESSSGRLLLRFQRCSGVSVLSTVVYYPTTPVSRSAFLFSRGLQASEHRRGPACRAGNQVGHSLSLQLKRAIRAMESAARDYGVVIDPQTLEVDVAATAARRL